MSYLNQLKYVLRIQFFRTGGTLIFLGIMQIVISLGISIGFTYLFATPDSQTTLYLATGAPTIILMMAGLVSLPMQNATAKTEGYNDYLRTLPVNRFAIIVSDTIIWLLLTIPGFVISTILTNLLFKPGYSISWTVIPIYLIVALTAIGIGYGFSFVMKPQMAMALSQLAAFGGLMFSPINFPMERLPEWLQFVHKILPLDSMAQVMREAMANTTFTAEPICYVKLIIWCIAGYGGAIYILNKK